MHKRRLSFARIVFYEDQEMTPNMRDVFGLIVLGLVVLLILRAL